MVEIERKFLVQSMDFISQSNKKNHIVQGYLSSNPERTVRVRIKNNNGYLTIKGMANAAGISRFEWENEISLADATALMQLCEPTVIDKTRYEVLVGNHTFEVDVFHGTNEGLILAEIELQNEDEFFLKPSWLGVEVTGKKEYYNSYLSQFSYKNRNGI